MDEFWKTVRAYRKFVGWVIVFGSLLLAMNQGWVSVPVIQTLAGEATQIIRALVPGGSGG